VRNRAGLMPIEYVVDPRIRDLLLEHGAIERTGMPFEFWPELQNSVEEQRLAIEKLQAAEHLRKRAVEAATTGAYPQWLEEQEGRGSKNQPSYATR